MSETIIKCVTDGVLCVIRCDFDGSKINRKGFMRNFACVALDNPKTLDNVGGVMRACHVFGVKMIAVSGNRLKSKIRSHVDTTSAYKHIPTIITDDVFDVLPFDCVPVAVELLPEASPLPTFSHPKRAFYIFGPEDGTLGSRITDRCNHVVSVPTQNGCMNLAACVNVMLYDRIRDNFVRDNINLP